MAERVEIQIVVDKQTGAISVAGQEVEKLGQQSEQAGQKAEQAGGAFKGLGDAVGALVAGGALVGFLQSAVSAQIEAEDAANRLSNALKNQGITSQAVTQDLLAFSTEMQNTTKFNDEAVTSAQTLLVSFGLTGDQLKNTTRAAADLASALGTDLNSATLLLGKAAAGETGSLSRYGIVIDESVPKAQRFQAALDQINQRFGGTAQNDVKTLGGALAQTANIYGDIQEKVGAGLTPAVISLNKAFLDLVPLLQNVGLVLAGVVGTAISLIKSGADVILGIFEVVGSAVATAVASVVQTLTSGFEIFKQLLSGNFSAAKDAAAQLVTDIQANVEQLVTDSSAAGAKVAESVTKNNETIKQTYNATFAEVAGINQQQADQAIALDDQVAAKRTENANLHASEKRRLAEEFTALEQGEFEAKRLRLENEIADLEAKGIREFEIKTAQGEQTVSLEQFKQAKLAEIRAQETKAMEAEEKKKKDLEKKAQDDAKKATDQRVADFKSTLGTIATLTQSGNENLKNIGKAAAITQAIMDTWAGANKALASAPPPINFALAAAVVAAGIANVAKIKAAQTGGTFGTGDEVLVGERGPEVIRFGAAGRVEANRDLRTRLADLAQAGEGAGSGVVVVNFNGGINIEVPGIDLTDPASRRALAQALADELQTESEEGITMARRVIELESRNAERAV